jgi:hypothetical protein
MATPAAASAQPPAAAPALLRIFDSGAEKKPPLPLNLVIDSAKALRTINKGRFLGTNIAIWNDPSTYRDPEVRQLFKDAGIGLVRLPGGSASDQYFWNGNGVRKGNDVDRSKYKNGHWQIDYSAWAPGFLGFFGFPKNPMTEELKPWHGNLNVKDQFDFIKALGAEPYVTVNAGTGTPRDAAEWVKWANRTMKYGAKYWEVGNELGGGWESGTLRADGKTMDGSMYGEIYRKFAKAIKAADPKVLVGSQGGLDFIKGALGHADAPVDFVTTHDYFSSEASSPDAMFATLDKIKPAIKEVRDVVQKLRPKHEVLVGMTEFNSQLFEGPQTSDLNSGLWLTAALGEMMVGGLDFATQWDAFTQKPDKGGGHGFMIEHGGVPKAEFWSYVILNHYLGDSLLEVDCNNSRVRCYASKHANGSLSLVAVNTSQTASFAGEIQLKGAAPQPIAECTRFSEREYAWDPVEFATPWNSGPTALTTRNSEGKLEIPAASVISCHLSVGNQGRKINSLGSATLTLAQGNRAPSDVFVSDADGKPLTDVIVKAKAAPGFHVEPAQAKTGPDGLCHFAVVAPPTMGEGRIEFSAVGYPTAEKKLVSVKPELILRGPSKVPVGETASYVAAVRYKKGSQYALIDTFDAQAKVEVPGSGSLVTSLKGGLASFSVVSPKAVSAQAIQFSAGDLSSKVDLSVFERTTSDKIVFHFDDAQSLARATGKLPFRINPNVRPNEGVLEIQLGGAKGWTQDVVDLEKLNELPDLDRANITSVFFDLGVDDSFDSGAQYADLVVVLQSEANYWMPMEKVDLTHLSKGQFKRVSLSLKPEFQRAMKAFTKLIFVVNSGSSLKGALWLDNLGFSVQRAK